MTTEEREGKSAEWRKNDLGKNSVYTVLCAGCEYKTNFTIGDKVGKGGYIKTMIIVGVDEFISSLLKELHWEVVDEDYVLGKGKSTHAEPVSENEIEHCA